jgi:carbon monoxide dehydrogenase subunit G
LLLEGKFTLKAAIRETWDSLIKPETLSACIPGCEKMEAIDDKTFNTIVVAKVGFISVRFQFTTTLTEIEPPIHLKAVGKGQDLRKQGSFSQETVVDIREMSAEELEVTYKSNVTIAGKLATFGDRIMRAKAKEMEREFTRALQEKLSAKKA